MTDSKINKQFIPIEKTILRIENIGFCKEDYDVMETHYPGIFKDINYAEHYRFH